MNCEECERELWILSELSEGDRAKVMSHVNECEKCAQLFATTQQISRMTESSRAILPVPINAAALTNRIMESIPKQKQHTFKLGLWLEYIFRTTSVALIVFMISEHVPSGELLKLVPKERSVVLNSSKIFKKYSESRTSRQVSLYGKYQKIKMNKLYESN